MLSVRACLFQPSHPHRPAGSQFALKESIAISPSNGQAGVLASGFHASVVGRGGFEPTEAQRRNDYSVAGLTKLPSTDPYVVAPQEFEPQPSGCKPDALNQPELRS